MNISVILGHPYESSLNAAIAAAAVKALRDAGHTVQFHDLCREQFDPVIPKEELVSDVTNDPLVKLHQEEIRTADGIIIVLPNWWGQPPAILKGWVDRVLRTNVAYTFPAGDSGGGLPIGLLRAQKALVFNMSNTPAEREDTAFGDPLECLWRDCIFDFCGVTNFTRRMFRVVADSTPAERAEWIAEVARMTQDAFPAVDAQ